MEMKMAEGNGGSRRREGGGKKERWNRRNPLKA